MADYLCPSAVPCRRELLVRPATREFQKTHDPLTTHNYWAGGLCEPALKPPPAAGANEKLHVAPDVPHYLENAAVPDLTVNLLFGRILLFLYPRGAWRGPRPCLEGLNDLPGGLRLR